MYYSKPLRNLGNTVIVLFFHFFFQIFQGKIPRSELSTRPLELFMCSVLKRQGYGEGFRWLAQYIDWKHVEDLKDNKQYLFPLIPSFIIVPNFKEIFPS